MDDDAPLFETGGAVHTLQDLAQYHTVAPQSPVLYYSSNCGHCVRFAPTYSAWAQKLQSSAPDLKVYALDLSSVDPRQASSYNSLFPKAPLPRFVPAMSLSGSRPVDGGDGINRVMWSDRDGEKSEKGLSAFLLNHSRQLSEDSVRNISSAFGLSENSAQLEGGSHISTKRNKMSPKRKSPHHKHKSPKHKSPKRRSASRGLNKWAEALKRARKELGIVGFEKIKKGGKLYSATRRIYDKM